jgi:hypothetical protein
LSNDIVDEEFRAGRKDEAGEPVDEHQEEAEGQTPSMCPNQLPGLCPGIRDIRFLFWFRHWSLDA